MAEFILPNLGEGVEQGDVLRVLVKPGDQLKREQPVLELETDKATIEVPSSVEGVVKEIRVKEGDKVKPGQAVLVVDGEGAADQPKEGAKKEAKKEAKEGEKKQPPKETEKEAAATREPRKAEKEKAGASAPTQEQEEGEAEQPEREEGETAAPPDKKSKASVVDIRDRQSAQPSAQVPPAASQAPHAPVSAPASPSVRRIAREIGVDIAQVTGSGPGGRITEEDVKNFARHVMSSVGGGGAVAGGQAPARPAGVAVPLPDFSKWGEVERRPMAGIRRKTAEHLARAWNLIPHVTQHDKADITALETLRKKYGAEVEKSGGKLTVTAIVTKILAGALRVFPQFNASIDVPGDAIFYKKYVHIGIAVDTEHGLLVPVIRNADQKNLVTLAAEIHQLAEKARARKLSLDEMSGGSMSITNLGGIGGTAFTPIINWPEAAILGLSRSATEPVWVENRWEPRLMLPLSLSYDHRLIDGADAIRFLRWVVEALEQPFTLMLRG